MKWIESMAAGTGRWREWKATPEATLDVFCCRGRTDGPTTVVTAGIHGDEYEGPGAVASLAKHIDPASFTGSLIAIPVANPSAFRAGTRTNPEDDLNLARSFPGRADGSPTQQLAYRLFGTIVSQANLLIDLHSGGVAYRFTPVAGFYGEADVGNRSFVLARQFGLKRLWRLPPTDGVLSCEAWKLGIAALGAEYLGAGQLSASGVSQYCQGVMNCLHHAGLLAEKPSYPMPQSGFEGDWQLASVEGIFRALCDLDAPVPAQTEIAEIVNARGERQQAFVAPYDGVILGLRSKAFIQPADWAVLLGRSIGDFR